MSLEQLISDLIEPERLNQIGGCSSVGPPQAESPEADKQTRKQGARVCQRFNEALTDSKPRRPVSLAIVAFIGIADYIGASGAPPAGAADHMLASCIPI